MGNKTSCFKAKNKAKGQGEKDSGTVSNYPVFPPPPPRVILADRERYAEHIVLRKHLLPRGETEDTPLYALFRIYECMVLEYVAGYRNELEWFYRDHPEWSVEEIPDPKDEDPERYAVLSCIPPLMVMAFNNLIKLGLPRDAPAILSWELVDEYKAKPESAKTYEKSPTWIDQVPPLSNELVLQMYDGAAWVKPDDEKQEPEFKKKNIIMPDAHIFFI